MFYNLPANFANSALLTITVAAILMLPIKSGRSEPSKVPTPRVNLTLWAWDKIENLSFLQEQPATSRPAVAFYAGTIYIDGSVVQFKNNQKELSMPENTSRSPVFRIETGRTDNHHLNTNTVFAVAEVIKNYLSDHPNGRIQIDFDAASDERLFYLHLLKQLRQTLPHNTHITITALASWCLSDRWLQPGCADEAIVMLFSLGRGQSETFSALAKQKLDSGCNIPLSLGLCASEPETNLRLAQICELRQFTHVYLFHPLPWSAKRYKKALAQWPYLDL